MPVWIRSRHVFFAIFLATVVMMAFGFWLQYARDLEPCPLCMTQRIFIVLAGLVGLVAALHGPRATGVRVYAMLLMSFSLVGAAVSIRHVWLQSLPPDRAPACGPDLAYMFDAFPLQDALLMLMHGDGNCAVVDWSFLGLSIPAWTLVAFAILAVLAFWSALRPRT